MFLALAACGAPPQFDVVKSCYAEGVELQATFHLDCTAPEADLRRTAEIFDAQGIVFRRDFASTFSLPIFVRELEDLENTPGEDRLSGVLRLRAGGRWIELNRFGDSLMHELLHAHRNLDHSDWPRSYLEALLERGRAPAGGWTEIPNVITAQAAGLRGTPQRSQEQP